MSTRPDKITGGCLCGSIRYTITFPPESSWPADSCTCQCTLCRKFTGSLISHDIILTDAQLSNITTSPTYKEYQPSSSTVATATRSFCSNCGSSLTWKADSFPGMVIVFIGTIDEEYLLGKKVGGASGEEKTEMGIKFKREGGLSKELTTMQMGHLFWDNVVEGVTDHEVGVGPKFLQSFPQE